MKRVLLSAGMQLAVLTSAAGQDSARPTNGAQLLQRTCKGCHDLHVVTSARKTDSQWELTLNQMLSRGAKASDQEAEIIFNYLCDNFGVDRDAQPSPSKSAPGWHAESAAEPAGAKDGWLALDKTYEDFALRLSFQCHFRRQYFVSRIDVEFPNFAITFEAPAQKMQ